MTAEKGERMRRERDFMKWIDHQTTTDAALKRRVEGYLRKMIIEQKVSARCVVGRHRSKPWSPSIS